MQLAKSNLGSHRAGVEYDDAHYVIAIGCVRQTLPATRIKSERRGHGNLSRQREPVRSVRRVLGLHIASAGQSRGRNRDHETDRGRADHVNLVAIGWAPDFNCAHTRFVPGPIVEAVIGWSGSCSSSPLRTLRTLGTGRPLRSRGTRRSDCTGDALRALCSWQANRANRTLRANWTNRPLWPNRSLRPIRTHRSCRTGRSNRSRLANWTGGSLRTGWSS
jgi:hypothetical protein